MTSTKPVRKPILLSADETAIITCALWHWEDCVRTGRHQEKSAGKDVAEYDRRIAAIRNLKARMFRARKENHHGPR